MMKSIFFVLSVLFFSISANAQCLKGNCDHGMGVYKYPDGTQYEGAFDRSEFHGKGKLTFNNGERYEGSFFYGKKHGIGRYFSDDGSFYIGDFKKDRRSGKGKMKYSNKDEYRGQWKDDLPNGEGEYIFSNGSRYIGEIVNGSFEGKGKMIYNDGSTYEGQWKDSELQEQTSYTSSESGTGSNVENAVDDLINTNQPEEFDNCNLVYCNNKVGKYTYQDGSVYIGDFKNGEPEGLGVCAYFNGSTYKGGWKHHAPHGRGIMYNSNGYVLDAQWQRGKVIKEYYAAHENQTENKAQIQGQGHSKPPAENVKKEKPPVSTPRGDGVTNIFALVVGIASYNSLPSLKYTDDDAYQVYAFLKSPEGGALPDNQIKILIDDAASRKEIIRNMDKIFSQADEDDSILLYISGHGLDGSFVPYDFDGRNNLLAYEEILTSLDNYNAKSKLCITDACYSGSMFGSRSSLNMAIDDFYMKVNGSGGGTAIITSSKREEVSLEYSGIRQGIFSHYLIKGLKGRADQNQDKYVSIGELFTFVRSNVQSYTKHAQNPTIMGQYDESMPVAFVR